MGTLLLLVALQAGPVSANIAIPSSARDGSRLVLHIDHLKLPPHSSGIVRVFAGLPNATAETSVSDDHFVGYFTILAKNSGDAARGVQRDAIALDLSHKTRLLANKKEITITLVPLGPAPDLPSAAPIKPTFARVYIAHK